MRPTSRRTPRPRGACAQRDLRAEVDGRLAVGCGSVAELAAAVAAPALDSRRACEGTRMEAAGRDSTHAAGQAGHVRRCRAIRGRTVPELAVIVEPPALDAAAGG